MDPFDALVGRWHDFSAQSKGEISAQFNEESRALFAEVVDACLKGAKSSDQRFSSSDEFAQYVLELRENEKAWSRSLGDLLVRSQEEADAGRKAVATTLLRDFIDACPWLNFSEIARTRMQDLGS